MVVAGCASNKPPPPALAGDPVVDGKNAMAYGPAKDRVLWQYRVALAAMRRSDYAEAKLQLDAAIASIGGIYTSDEGANKARSYFHAEAKKTFIGEPYERAVAYYYRGILYWMDGETDNARACFRSAEIQDADTENHEYAADYVLFDYLDGLVTTRLGGDGSDELSRAQKNARGKSNPPPYHTNANVMVFLDFGRGPLKYAAGKHAEQLRFREQASTAVSVNLRLGTHQFPLVPYDDIQWQATTRGGRVMDHILANKAVFKSATGAAAVVAGATSIALAGNKGNGAWIAGGIAIAAGLISAATTPEADIRMWETLPRYLSFAAIELPPGQHSLAIDFRDAAGHTLLTKTVTFTIAAGSNKDTVLYVSEYNS